MKREIKRNLIDLAAILGLFLLITISYLIFKPLFSTLSRGAFAHTYSILLLVVIIVVGIVLKIKNKLSLNTLILLIFLAGVVLKINYVLITPYNYRQHDVVTSYNDGHQAYAWTLFTTWKLPTLTTSDGYLAYQFYHPPLNAFVQAVWMNISKEILSIYNVIVGQQLFDVSDPNVLFETTEILSCLYMVISSYFGVKLIKRLNLSKLATIVACVFICLFTSLVIESAQENNDPLCIMFCFLALYYTYDWYYTKSYVSSILIGLFVGLAAMAKFSGFVAGIPAFIIYLIFLFKTINNKDKSEIKKLIFQPLIIALIAAPLGLWFQVYAAIKFNQPIGYVFGNLTIKLYKGDYSFFQRFICFWDLKDLCSSLYPSTFIHYNLFNFIVKSSIYGEYSLVGVDSLFAVGIASNYIFVLLSLVVFVFYSIISRKENIKEKVFAWIIMISNIICMVYFNIKMPYGCTMDFRYIVPILFGFIVLLGLSVNKAETSKNTVYKWFVRATLIAGSFMLVFSNLTFLFGI